MKNLTVLLFTIFILNSCSAQPKKNIENTEIEYSTTSRGSYQNIKVKNQDVWITRGKDKTPSTYKIDNSKWKNIQNEFDLIDLDSVSTFKAPTDKRTYDGAAIGILTITYNGKKYQTNGFDNGTPPKEIANFVDLISHLGAE